MGTAGLQDTRFQFKDTNRLKAKGYLFSPIQHNTEGSSQYNETRKINQMYYMQIGKEKLLLSTDSTTRHVENLRVKDRYTIYQFFLQTHNEKSKNTVKKIAFTIASKRIKYLGVNLTQEVQDL